MQTDLERNMSRRIVDYDILNSKVSDIIHEHVPSPRIWLDTGCGTGGLVRSNLQRFPETQFVLADPSQDNIAVAKEYMHGEQRCLYVSKPTEILNFGESILDVVTAMFCHHYFKDIGGRKQALQNCFRMLKKGGIFVTAEHVRHDDDHIAEKDAEWLSFMKGQGLPEEFAKVMITRRDTEYFPLSKSVHEDLLKLCGYTEVHIFWLTCSDIGIWAKK